jgi:hypothetical protein
MAEPELRHPNSPNSKPNSGTDRFGKVGMAIVGFAAAVLSFQTWVRIAEAVGFTAHWHLSVPLGFGTQFTLVVPIWISSLYPCAIDVYAVVVTRIWLMARRGSEVAKFAKANSLGAIGLALVSQGTYHAMVAAGWNVGEAWPFVILVSSFPPVLVGLVAHLYYVVANEREEAAKAGLPDVILAGPKIEPETESKIEPEPNRAPKKPRPKANSDAPKPKAPRTGAPEPTSNVVSLDRRTDEQVAIEVREFVREHRARTGKVPGRHVVAAGVRIAYNRTRELIDKAVAELGELDRDEDEDHPAELDSVGIAAGGTS